MKYASFITKKLYFDCKLWVGTIENGAKSVKEQSDST